MKKYAGAVLLVWTALSVFLWPYGWPGAPFLAGLLLGELLLLTLPPVLAADAWSRLARISAAGRAVVAAIAALVWVLVLLVAGQALSVSWSDGPLPVGELIQGAILFAIAEGLIVYVALPVRLPTPR